MDLLVQDLVVEYMMKVKLVKNIFFEDCDIRKNVFLGRLLLEQFHVHAFVGTEPICK